MINIQKVIYEIHCDGRYDAILDVAKKTLKTDSPTLKDIEKLVFKNEYYLKEYKDLNRWGELTSIHIKELTIKDSDDKEIKDLKNKINTDMKFLKNREEYEVKSKNGIYLAWTGFIALPAIYVIDNIVRLFTDLYKENNELSVYLSFIIVLVLSAWGYKRVSNNHAKLHKEYLQTQKEMRELISFGLKENYFTFEEIYIH